jgi:hypothetical protein
MTEGFLTAHEISQKNTVVSWGVVDGPLEGTSNVGLGRRGKAGFFLVVPAYPPAFPRIYLKMLRLFVTTHAYWGNRGL